eukprot:15096-Amphidinium_carterae.1
MRNPHCGPANAVANMVRSIGADWHTLACCPLLSLAALPTGRGFAAPPDAFELSGGLTFTPTGPSQTRSTTCSGWDFSPCTPRTSYECGP